MNSTKPVEAGGNNTVGFLLLLAFLGLVWVCGGEKPPAPKAEAAGVTAGAGASAVISEPATVPVKVKKPGEELCERSGRCVERLIKHFATLYWK